MIVVVDPAPGPVRSNTRKRTFSLPGIQREYKSILDRVNDGESLAAALNAVGISRTHFTRKRCISEAAMVDEPALQQAMLLLRKITLHTLYPAAKDICNRKLDALRTLYSQGEVLPPKGRY